VITPRIATDAVGSPRALRRAVTVELVLAAAVLAATAVLGSSALPIDG
jgi:hypothetical protein